MHRRTKTLYNVCVSTPFERRGARSKHTRSTKSVLWAIIKGSVLHATPCLKYVPRKQTKRKGKPANDAKILDGIPPTFLPGAGRHLRKR